MLTCCGGRAAGYACQSSPGRVLGSAACRVSLETSSILAPGSRDPVVSAVVEVRNFPGN